MASLGGTTLTDQGQFTEAFGFILLRGRYVLYGQFGAQAAVAWIHFVSHFLVGFRQMIFWSKDLWSCRGPGETERERLKNGATDDKIEIQEMDGESDLISVSKAAEPPGRGMSRYAKMQIMQSNFEDLALDAVPNTVHEDVVMSTI